MPRTVDQTVPPDPPPPPQTPNQLSASPTHVANNQFPPLPRAQKVPNATHLIPTTHCTRSVMNEATNATEVVSPQSTYVNAKGNVLPTRNKVRLQHRSYQMVNGKPVVIFTKEEEDMLAQTCKWTIIGKFSHIRPSIDSIRSEFAKIIKSKGSIKIGAYDLHHVFIDFDNIEDHRNVLSRNYINLGGDKIMKIGKWSTKFKPEVETNFAPVWINLPDLPWHYYEWDALCRIVEPIGIPLLMDKATISKTRPTTAKVRVEIDLTKPLLSEVLVEIINEKGNMEIITQKIEYETIPAFCSHCKIQGHHEEKCRKLHPDLRNERPSIFESPQGGNYNQQKKTLGNTSREMDNINSATRNVTNNNGQRVANGGTMEQPGNGDDWHTVMSKRGKGNNKNNVNINIGDDEQGSNNSDKNQKKSYKAKEGQNAVIVTHSIIGNMENMDISAQVTTPPQQQIFFNHATMTQKHTRLDKETKEKRARKPSLTTIKSSMTKISQGKKSLFPDVEDQSEILNNSLVHLKENELPEANKKVNKAKGKFQSRATIPTDVTLESERNREEKNYTGDSPFFGLDTNLAISMAGRRAKEKETIEEQDLMNLGENNVLDIHKEVEVKEDTSTKDCENDIVMEIEPGDFESSKSDDEQVRGSSNSLTCEVLADTPIELQHNVILFNNLSPRGQYNSIEKEVNNAPLGKAGNNNNNNKGQKGSNSNVSHD
ncbi:hypothetical protein A4A49_25768 [Nicotiana attenuata]|uniref:DUF4283 domain-containing protein n=1 Tax=Nicotiana attenuata TaxID=49451 RepID=A0A1J6KC33_NICAT|nr:hypothetical protein A4A49_25768 [Nicotiana attenuata]